jgi:epoxyqueuosine reductase
VERSESVIDPHQRAAVLKKLARDAGFDRVGIASPEPTAHADYLKQWLADGHAGSMHFIAGRLPERLDPSVYFPGVRSVLCVAMNYHVPLDRPADALKIARYALGTDYHTHIKDRLHAIADQIRALVPGAQTRCGVDTVPLLERELAAREQIGSWLFLGEVLTTIDLPFDSPAVDRCGTCTRCIDACPTEALQPYRINASRCISYLTIEHTDDVAAEFRGRFDGWVFGCDICQDVCPYNRRTPAATHPELMPRELPGHATRAEIEAWDEQTYWRMTRHTAMRRVKLPQWKRNASLAAERPTT